MPRLFCFAGVAVLALGTIAFGEEPTPRPMLNVRPGAVAWTTATTSIGLPGYPMLQMENVQKELGLSTEQKEKLKEIGTKAAESLGKESRLDWTKLRGMKPDELRKAQKEIADRNAKRVEETKKQVEQILTPKQLDQLKDIEFRQRASYMLYMPQVLQQIELTDEQKEKMQKIREETQSKMAQVQQDSQTKSLGVLTAEQKKKLKEFSEKEMPGWGGPVQLLNPRERPKDRAKAAKPE